MAKNKWVREYVEWKQKCILITCTLLDKTHIEMKLLKAYDFFPSL